MMGKKEKMKSGGSSSLLLTDSLCLFAKKNVSWISLSHISIAQHVHGRMQTSTLGENKSHVNLQLDSILSLLLSIIQLPEKFTVPSVGICTVN